MATATSGSTPSATLAGILQLEKCLPADLRNKLTARYAKLLQDMTSDAGEFLHELDCNKHSQDEVKAVVKTFPSALSHVDDEGRLPIHKAVWFNEKSIPLIALLAEEGVKLNIGGDGQRGGLLVVDPADRYSCNVLQTLANFVYAENPSTYDSYCLDAMKQLRKSKLLLQKDILEFHLLFFSCTPESKKRFNHLVDWGPESLKDDRYNGKPLLHATDQFVIILKAGLKHYPEELGFLFRKNIDGQKTACELAFNTYGQEKTLKMI